MVPPAQAPLVGEQLPPVVHWLEVQATGVCPTHAPVPSQANDVNTLVPLHFTAAFPAVQAWPVAGA